MSDEIKSSQQPDEEKSFFKIIVHSFFIIPFLIAVLCLLLFTAVKLLTQEKRTVYNYLNDVKVGGLTKRWQAAFELSKILSHPELTPKDRRFANELISVYKQAQHDDNRVRQYLALAMGRTGDPVYLDALLEGLKESNETNIAADLYALGMLKDNKAVNALYQYLDHPQARIRSVAVVALGEIADPGSRIHLKRRLSDTEPNVQWGAAISLARMKDDSGKEMIRKMMDRAYWNDFPEVDPEEQNNLILMAIDAAKGFNDRQLNEKIKELSQTDRNMNVRRSALAALSNRM